MLLIFNIDWDRFNIDAEVSAANGRMKDLTDQAGLSTYMIFNLASLGAGEHITGLFGHEGDVRDRTVSFMRRMHHRVKRKLEAGQVFRANRETSEMLDGLKGDGHSLMAVWTMSTRQLEDKLKKARTLDFFEEKVLGSDKVQGDWLGSLTSLGLYREALRRERTIAPESIIISDRPEGIEEARFLKPLATVGYVCSNQDWDEKGRQLKELTEAGADYALIGGYCLGALPGYISGQRKLKSTLEAIEFRRP